MGIDLLSIAFGNAPKINKRPQQSPFLDPSKQILLRHHKGAFTGCFSLYRSSDIDWMRYKMWKEKPTIGVTSIMANRFVKVIQNTYSLLTTPPPSQRRDASNYCTYKLAEAISMRTNIPFIPVFQQRFSKRHHGRFASLEQDDPLTICNPTSKSILLIDDCVTSGTTMNRCYKVLKNLNNHVDGLVFISASGGHR